MPTSHFGTHFEVKVSPNRTRRPLRLIWNQCAVLSCSRVRSCIELSFDEKRDNLIFDLVEKALDRQWQRISDLDSKAANQIGFTGVIIGFVLGNASLLQAKVATNGLLLESFIAAVLALLTSFSLGITGFMTRKWRVVPNPIAL